MFCVDLRVRRRGFQEVGGSLRCPPCSSLKLPLFPGNGSSLLQGPNSGQGSIEAVVCSDDEAAHATLSDVENDDDIIQLQRLFSIE